METYNLKNRRFVNSGRILDTYFNSEISDIVVTKSLPFGRGKSEECVPCFECKGKMYAILGYDHFNGHFSSFKDKASVYGLHIAEVVKETSRFGWA